MYARTKCKQNEICRRYSSDPQHTTAAAIYSDIREGQKGLIINVDKTQVLVIIEKATSPRFNMSE